MTGRTREIAAVGFGLEMITYILVQIDALRVREHCLYMAGYLEVDSAPLGRAE